MLQAFLLYMSVPSVLLKHLVLACLTGFVCGIVAARLHETLVSPPYAALAGAILLYPSLAVLVAAGLRSARPDRENLPGSC